MNKTFLLFSYCKMCKLSKLHLLIISFQVQTSGKQYLAIVTIKNRFRKKYEIGCIRQLQIPVVIYVGKRVILMPSTEFAIRNPVIQQQQRSCNKSVLSSLHQGSALGPVASKLVIMMNICTGSIRVKGPFYCTITIKGCVQCSVYVSTLCVHFLFWIRQCE